MTRQVCTIDRKRTLADAHTLMRIEGIRHLPVVDQERLVGIVTERDLRLLESCLSVNPSAYPVELAMTDAPYTVAKDTPLPEVLDMMRDRKYGSVIVVGAKGVEGIFTALDACQVLADVLRRNA